MDKNVSRAMKAYQYEERFTKWNNRMKSEIAEKNSGTKTYKIKKRGKK